MSARFVRLDIFNLFTSCSSAVRQVVIRMPENGACRGERIPLIYMCNNNKDVRCKQNSSGQWIRLTPNYFVADQNV